MKKLSVLSFSALLVGFLFSASMMTSCKKGAAKLAGTYVVSVEDLAMTKDVPAEQLEMMKAMFESITMELSSDGKVKSNSPDGLEEGTFKLDGDKVAITIAGETQTFTIDGKKLKGNIGGQEMVFKKK